MHGCGQVGGEQAAATCAHTHTHTSALGEDMNHTSVEMRRGRDSSSSLWHSSRKLLVLSGEPILKKKNTASESFKINLNLSVTVSGVQM